MKFKLRVLLIAMLFIPLAGLTQQKDTLIKKLDSLNRKKDSVGQVNNINRTAYNENTRITFKNYFVLLVSDMKQEFTQPFHMKKKDWLNFGKFAVIEVALGFADESIQQEAMRFTSRNPGVKNTGNYISKFGGVYEGYTLAAIATYGLVFKKRKMVTTTLLATQAYLVGGALESVTKFLAGRTRPSYYDPSVEAEPTFLGPFSKTGKDASGKTVYSSFPSGHTTVAFAAATVFASEYKNIKWVPIVAYSAATLIGLSRITENQHWATDVVAGAAIGYLAGINVVNNYHRYAKIQAAKKNTVSLNLQYFNNQLMPVVVYKFR
jgi:membrane-associated phospholipid phosphatase